MSVYGSMTGMKIKNKIKKWDERKKVGWMKNGQWVELTIVEAWWGGKRGVSQMEWNEEERMSI